MNIPTYLERPHTIRSVNKAQWVRLVDVFWLGPTMIYGSLFIKNQFHRQALLIFGIATILFNGRNYLENQERMKEAAKAGRVDEFIEY